MIIRTITCHDVYNVGASLQAYALYEYLRQQGHDVKIIDYKPEYLCKRYNFKAVDNPRFEKPFLLKLVYLVLKFPRRLWERPGKRNFDNFRKQYMDLTERYRSLDELKSAPPLAELFIAGSDQIWNSFFQNGKDGAFYLEFAPSTAVKASYAASFASDEIADGWENQVKLWIEGLDKISVREKSSLKLLKKLGITGCAVLDPVFLLSTNHWKKMLKFTSVEKDIFVYDFDNSELVKQVSVMMKERYGLKITTFFPTKYSDRKIKCAGPLEFLTAIYNSKIIISNSFHATAFSLIFHKDFYVIKRNENINIRMIDLLNLVGLDDRIISSDEDIVSVKPINWEEVDNIIQDERDKSIQFLMELIKKNEKS